MALIVEDRVLETSTTTGTGAFTLSGAYTGFRTFSSVCSVGDTCYYLIEAVDSNGVPTGDWETGLGTYSAANTLTRTTVSRSSNSNATVSFSAGTKRVAISAIAASRPRSRIVSPDLAFTTNDTGAFATLGNVIIPVDDLLVDRLYGTFNAALVGDVYSMFLATLDASNNITGTVVSGTSVTTTATGNQTAAFDTALTKLTGGTRFYLGLVITNRTTTTACRALGLSTGTAPYRVTLPEDNALRLASTTQRVWFSQNSNAPTSATPVSSSIAGGYSLGLRIT